MDSNVSKKITHINFALIFLIVVLHSSCLRFITNSNLIIVKIYEIINVICDASVPAFFILSAYLYYRNYDISKTKSKYKSRLHSLVIPYFLWSIIFLIYYEVINIIPSISNVFNNSFELGINNILKNILMATCAEGMWFVRVLIVYTIFSPLIYLIMKRNKIFNYFLISTLLIINLIFKFGYSNPIFWMPIYLLGTNFGIFYRKFDNSPEIVKYSKNKLLFFVLLLLMIAFVVSYFESNSIVYYLYRMVSPLILLSILDLLKLYKYNVASIEKSSFFIYCIHLPIVKVVRKILFLIFGYNPIYSLGIFLVTIITSLIIIKIIILLLERISKPVFRLLTGERS